MFFLFHNSEAVWYEILIFSWKKINLYLSITPKCFFVNELNLQARRNIPLDKAHNWRTLVAAIPQGSVPVPIDFRSPRRHEDADFVINLFGFSATCRKIRNSRRDVKYFPSFESITRLIVSLAQTQSSRPWLANTALSIMTRWFIFAQGEDRWCLQTPVFSDSSGKIGDDFLEKYSGSWIIRKFQRFA